MEYIDGISVGKIILKNKNDTQKYLVKSIEIQISLNKLIVDDFPSMKGILENNISNVTGLETVEKQKLLKKMNNMEFGNNLCHGDFHIMNLVETTNGIKIIDWVNSSSGNPEADIYRTYLLYKITSEELAKIYIENYCRKANAIKENIVKWAPIMAGARLSEGIENKYEIEQLKRIVRENV